MVKHSKDYIGRPDFVQGLLHLTRKRNKKARHFELQQTTVEIMNEEVSAFDVLKEILTDGYLYGSTTRSGFIKGDNSAVCFSEMPISGLRYQLEYEENRYEPYGLAFRKKTLFKYGARPVIYLPNSEGVWIPAEEKWRHVRFEIEDENVIDHTHEREWRLKGDLDLTDITGFFVITKTWAEAEEIKEMPKKENMRIRGYLPMEILSLWL